MSKTRVSWARVSWAGRFPNKGMRKRALRLRLRRLATSSNRVGESSEVTPDAGRPASAVGAAPSPSHSRPCEAKAPSPRPSRSPPAPRSPRRMRSTHHLIHVGRIQPSSGSVVTIRSYAHTLVGHLCQPAGRQNALASRLSAEWGYMDSTARAGTQLRSQVAISRENHELCRDSASQDDGMASFRQLGLGRGRRIRKKGPQRPENAQNRIPRYPMGY